ncbi:MULTISPECIES: OmpW/AlkL family protein [Pseudomonas]|jgi:outer membrane protein|uniref:Outer membrane beta-barrel protein n=1 Tax=Pseudomonas carnis TaxID=2487355 RepID=A0ABT5RFU4_9PSED|nr:MULTISPECIES: OmpW family outer membrane protein [Pseudomonas]MCO2030550.1 OmpW family protein [Pseudomonas aeruginosa]MDD1944098.1 outer membrane beta-barrel protein [Pseudomonas carnis]MEE1919402.1 OmpW family outer membrane protein [Pseudomonas asiatica]HBO8809900.1 OmpW family protein [Pseudomonas aeruginosa]
MRRLFAPALAACLPLIPLPVLASEAPLNIVRIGYADIQFNTDSGDMTGMPGTTPDYVQATVRDSSTLALIYERRLSGPWSLVLQSGAPPVIDFDGAGSAAPLGKVGSARAWFPAVLIAYNFELFGLQPYVALGVNYTWFSEEKMTAAYTRAFGGTSSTSELDDSFGAVAKVGVEIPLADNWSAGFSYSRYWIDTTATIKTQTPGLGEVKRKIDVEADPDVYAFTIGYHF